METTKLNRKFIFIKDNQEIELADVNPLLQVKDIVELYSNTYPELINASIEPKGVIDDNLVYHFSCIAGTKG